MTLSQAVDSAVRNYPSVRVSQEQINAAAAGIQLARTAYLPQSGRAGAGESRHQKQRLRDAAAAERDPFHFRSGHRVEQLRNGVGQRHGSAGDLGTFRFRFAAGERGRRRGGASRIGSGSEEDRNSMSRSRPPTLTLRWSRRRKRCGPRKPESIEPSDLRGRFTRW